jgi:hypothetical protein
VPAAILLHSLEFRRFINFFGWRALWTGNKARPGSIY